MGPEPAAGRRWTRLWLPLALAGFAFGCRLLPVLRGGGLFGRDTYDPSVYYGAAVALANGRLPYRDFLLLHPPGLLLVLQPFAWLGGLAGDPVGMAAARLGFMAMGAGSAVLIYVILYRQSVTAAWVGAGLYAVWFPAVYTERMTRLEAPASFLVLVGILVLLRGIERHPARTATLAGALFGLAAVMKVWGAALVLVLVIWLWYHHGWKRALAAAGGAAGAALVVMAPFMLASPLWWDMLVLDLLARSRSPVSLLARTGDILGIGPVPEQYALVPVLVAVALTVVAAALALRTPPGQLFVGLSALAIVMLLATSNWYRHYPALSAAPLCLLYGTATGVVIERFPARVRRWASVGLAVALAAAGVVLMAQRVGSRFPGPELAAALAGRPGCITTDNPTALILSDTLRRNLAGGCPVVVDLTGYNVHFSRRDDVTDYRRDNPVFQRCAVDYLASGTSVVLIRLDENDFSPQSLRTIESWPVVDKAGRVEIREPPSAAAQHGGLDGGLEGACSVR